MITTLALAIALQKAPIVVPAFGTWDGKAWAGLALGTPEKELGKQVPLSKTAIADPASIRIASDRKGWIVTGLLTDVNKRGSLCGFAVESEKQEPLLSLEPLETELGPSDPKLFPRVSYSPWAVATWKAKGIVAVITQDRRPLVQKVLLTDPQTAGKNLDVWQSEPAEPLAFPVIPVEDFDVSVSSDPSDSGVNRKCRDYLWSAARSRFRSHNGRGWEAVRRDGRQIKVSLSLYRKKDITASLSVSLDYNNELGPVSITESSSDTMRNESDLGFRVAQLFDTVMDKLPKSIEEKYRLLVWRAEWRPFYALAKP